MGATCVAVECGTEDEDGVTAVFGKAACSGVLTSGETLMVVLAALLVDGKMFALAWGVRDAPQRGQYDALGNTAAPHFGQ